MKTLNITHIHTSRYMTVCTELHSIKLRDDIFTGHFVLSQIPRLVMSIVLSSAHIYVCIYIYIYMDQLLVIHGSDVIDLCHFM